ncbi:MAG TPA: phosphate acetyltransferase [Anaeromyxobacteraceae bacterium]|nr:phosphate acetyltransferase [Anaeromyxobacteraceae bacterium]
MPRTLLVAPAGRQVGLTTVCLGLVRAFDRLGTRVAFVRPLAGDGDERSRALVKLVAGVAPPAPVPRGVVEELLAAGDDQTLLEQVVAACARAAEGAEVLVVEGMAPEPGIVWSSRVNALMLKALDAELVLVGAPGEASAAEAAAAVAIAARGYGAQEGRVRSVMNRVCAGLDAHRAALEAERLRPLAVLPCRGELQAPRLADLAAALSARVLHRGDLSRRRVRDVVLCAMTVQNAVKAFRPGALLITPGDRSDVITAAALAAQGGLPLAGLLLTGGLEPEPRILELCRDALAGGLPILAVEAGSFDAASRVARLDPAIPADDAERADAAATFVADRLDQAWLKELAGTPRAPRLSPPAFRHGLVEAARAAGKRIVLPEGAEPRTLAAAAIVGQRGIARCVLLGDPAEIRESARKHGVALHPSTEIVDAAAVAPRYVDALVARRKAKGMTPAQADQELTDPIMVGTMMMALDEADGLVSGAVHTTAHTIRPALQIIKTVPGCNLVSSVFFMCLPDQVLVFGDCAVNPNPTAEQLADIAIQSADSAAAFGIPPRVAMLSYSTGASGAGEEVEKVKKATALARAARPDLAIDGPLQYDAAVMPDVARTKMPGSKVAGQATVFVFPDLNTGNVTYKAVQRSANVVSMGPMLQGLAKPVNDLSRGCLVEDIVFTVTLTAVQAERSKRRPAPREP